MKKILILLVGLFFFSPTMEAVHTTPIAPKEKTTTTKEIVKAQKQEAKNNRKQARQDKKIQKLQQKLKKKGMDKGGSGIWNDDTFRLGALIALGGLALRLLGFIPLLGGIINLIGTLLLLLGIGIMIWVLIK